MLMRSAYAALLLLALLGRGIPAAAAGLEEKPSPGVEKRVAVRLAGDARRVFVALGELYGVRVVVDEEFPARWVRLRLAEADFDTALRLAAQVANAFWISLADGTILVAANTPEKHRQYEPQVLQTFSLAGSTPEELAETVRLLREVLDMRRIRADTRTNTFTVRDTPERLALAARLLAELRRDPGEVLVEALLLEVDRERARRLGILPPQQAIIVHLGTGFVDFADLASLIDALQALLGRSQIPEALRGVSLDTLLGELAADPNLLKAALPPFVLLGGGATTFAATLPGATLNLLDLASVTRSLRRVSLRARHRQEATLFVGERFPVVLATFSSIFFPRVVLELIQQGLFVPPIPAVQYEELGLRLTAEPHLHTAGEVTLRIKLDIRTLTPTTLNTIPIFSNRVIEQTVRLKAGEVLLLSGMRSQTQEEIREGTPGLGRLPGLGQLFSRRARRMRETELLVLLRPRILRPSRLDRAAPRALYVGTEARLSPLGAVPATPTTPRPPQTPPRKQPPQQN
ncbi:MAG: type II secretion system protein GspD [Terriglobia bacterium]